MSMQNAIDCFSKVVFEKDAQYCFALSKMTNVIETKEVRKYRMVSSPTEFYEMIARVADLKFKTDPISLPEKILRVLDQVMANANLKVVIPKEYGDINESESDEDY
jgi:hypothetical protein